MIAAAKKLAAESTSSGVIYFARAGHSGPIKIGFSRDAVVRLSNLQTASPFRLKLLATIAGGREKNYRKALKEALKQ